MSKYVKTQQSEPQPEIVEKKPVKKKTSKKKNNKEKQS